MREAKLSDCLTGHFSHLESIPPPSWLGDALEPDADSAKDLHGSLIAFHWETWGWCIGRLDKSPAIDCNFSAVYDGKWVEQHTLHLDSYDASGNGGYGSWCLLAPKRPQ